MKKHISLVFTLALLMAVSFGCKVGAEDPATLGSRNGRLLGTWKLNKIEGTDVTTNILGTFTETTTYDGTILTITDSPGGSSTASYALEIVIGKDGILNVTESEDGDVLTETSYWEWLNTEKNKSQVLLNTNSRVNGVWSVLRLAGKELILENKSVRSTASSGNTNTNTSDVKFTFEAN